MTSRPLYLALSVVVAVCLGVVLAPRAPKTEVGVGQVRVAPGLWRSCDGPHAVFTNSAGAIAVLRDARGLCPP